ncbi:uncharacterized mitochondrial protein AtMg00810-like [Aristolochia californica]|uniref:uncharacterized mitochondrial protein AtMg00810-like n=1 Tax=Aristolochia californica TaxID=171875 RepID=UPI0035DE7E04
MGSHPMLTHAKAGIFKSRHSADLAYSGSSGLLYALLTSTEPKGFKSTAKNPVWLAAMDDEVQALQNNPLESSLWPQASPHAWFKRFNSFLTHLGFYCSHADTSLFVFHKHSDIFYLLLYVDDIIITGNNSSLLDSFASKLHSEFVTKDLGSLCYFLDLEATPTADGLFLSRLKYVRDILARAQLLDNKPVHTPMAYLTITHPDIAHAVNSVSQFLHSPTDDHFLVVKRIIRYVKGTLHFGLSFRPSASPGSLVAYSDADWAGCPDTRRSTSGYSIYLGDNLVSWSAKKQPTVSLSNRI